MARFVTLQDGKLVTIDIPDTDVPKAHALMATGKIAPYGSPEHMAMIGTPMQAAMRDSRPTVTGGDLKQPEIGKAPLSPNDEAANYAGLQDSPSESLLRDVGITRQRAVGALKGMVKTGAGLASMAGVPDSSPRMQAAQEYVKPATPEEAQGTTGEQIGEFVVPALAAQKVRGALALERSVYPLARNAAGQMMPAARRALLQNALARAGVSTAVQAGGTGLISQAQGGDFGTGAVLGAAGGALGEAASAVAPKLSSTAMNILKAARSHPAEAASGGTALGYFGGRFAYDNARRLYDKVGLPGAAVAALALHPAGRTLLNSLLRSAPATYRAIDHAINSNAAETISDAEAHKNIGD